MQTNSQARSDVIRYSGGFYKSRRRHYALGYRRPNEVHWSSTGSLGSVEESTNSAVRNPAAAHTGGFGPALRYGPSDRFLQGSASIPASRSSQRLGVPELTRHHRDAGPFNTRSIHPFLSYKPAHKTKPAYKTLGRETPAERLLDLLLIKFPTRRC